MTTKEDIVEYMNLLAKALSLVHENEKLLTGYNSILHYKRYETEIKKRMDRLWRKDLNNTSLFSAIINIIDNIAKMEDFEKRIVQAVELCKWMDEKITYEQEEYADNVRDKFSVYEMFPRNLNRNIVVFSLNNNVTDIKIWINPKFETFPIISDINGETKENIFANRDVFWGINKVLKHICYFDANKYPQINVKNVILNPCSFMMKSSLKIFFSPLSDKKNHLICDYPQIEYHDVKMEGIAIVGIKDEQSLSQRIKRDWELACDEDSDIFFAPEMLGTAETCEFIDNKYNKMIMDYARDNIFSSVPKLTFLPSRWKDGHNNILIFDSEGNILCDYEKNIPYEDKKNHRIEALVEHDSMQLVMFHIPGYHRISILICAEFIYEQEPNLREFLCSCLQCTLIIVPSYSKGETDFLNEVSSIMKYGTTVIWGNCCGAVSGTDKVIGCVKLVGNDRVEMFGDFCKCEMHCQKNTACGFAIEIPLVLEKSKSKRTECKNLVKHIVSSTPISK